MRINLLSGKDSPTYKHGHVVNRKPSRTYNIWSNMKKRCNNPNLREAKYYRDKGITYCDRWEEFENFLSDMGECPLGLTLERLDTNKNYGPDNCVWATWKHQQNNRTNNRHIIVNGQDRTVAQWADYLNIPQYDIRNRLKKGLDGAEIIKHFLDQKEAVHAL